MTYSRPARIAAGVTGVLLLAASTTAVDADPAAAVPVAVEYDAGDYESLVAAYIESGERVWIPATVTIAGTTFENVGFRLEEGSALTGLDDEHIDHPESLPWTVSLDQWVGGQAFGRTRSFTLGA